MIKILLIFLGGGVGSTLRYAIGAGMHALVRRDEEMPHEEAILGQIPLGTLAVNFLGCFLIGLLVPLLAGDGKEAWRALLIVGLLGGFTTFSAFGLETYELYRAGHPWLSLSYALGSVVVGVAAAFAGIALSPGSES